MVFFALYMPVSSIYAMESCHFFLPLKLVMSYPSRMCMDMHYLSRKFLSHVVGSIVA